MVLFGRGGADRQSPTGRVGFISVVKRGPEGSNFGITRSVRVGGITRATQMFGKEYDKAMSSDDREGRGVSQGQRSLLRLTRVPSPRRIFETPDGQDIGPRHPG
jgi:hypothetical protein